MKNQVQSNASIGDKYLNKHYQHVSNPEAGFSLLELMAVVLIIAMMAVITMPLLQAQVAAREIDSIARRFIAHAHFARQLALYRGESVTLSPLADHGWEGGWVTQSGCVARKSPIQCSARQWLSHGHIHPVYFKLGGKQFIDPHSGKRGILFNAAGAAKMAQGGFVANRLVLGHATQDGLERHLILGSGGRWRICDPTLDAKRCH